MRVKFRNKTLNVENKSESKKEFYAAWNGYTIEVTPYETEYYSSGSRKLKYEAMCVNPMGCYIVNTTTHNTISEGVQECFNNISLDVDDMKSDYDELGEWLELLKDYL